MGRNFGKKKSKKGGKKKSKSDQSKKENKNEIESKEVIIIEPEQKDKTVKNLVSNNDEVFEDTITTRGWDQGENLRERYAENGRFNSDYMLRMFFIQRLENLMFYLLLQEKLRLGRRRH